MHVTVGLWRRLSAEELMLLNCGVGDDSWESLGLQGDPTSPFWRRSTLGFLGRNDAKAETPVLWLPHAKSWLIEKDSDAERIGGRRRRERQRMRWLDGITDLMDMSDGQGGLVCCDSWGRKESDTTEWLNWTEQTFYNPTQRPLTQKLSLILRSSELTKPKEKTIAAF